MKRYIKYMIHACIEREEYVTNILLPSLTKQGIKRNEIHIWYDTEKWGNLKSFVESSKWVAQTQDPKASIWHLQDDVLPSKQFREVAERGYVGFASGFCNELFDGERTNYIGVTTPNGMWFSFQCILIPNAVMGRFADWYENDCIPNNLLPEYVSTGKCDDSIFREYVMAHEARLPAINLFPNIVDHIDFLIGGTVINKHRQGEKRQAYWRDEALDEALTELTNALSSNGRTADFDSGSLGSNPSGAVPKKTKKQKRSQHVSSTQ